MGKKQLISFILAMVLNIILLITGVCIIKASGYPAGDNNALASLGGFIAIVGTMGLIITCFVNADSVRD